MASGRDTAHQGLLQSLGLRGLGLRVPLFVGLLAVSSTLQ